MLLRSTLNYSQTPTKEKVPCVRLKTLVETQNLACRRSRHRCDEKRVTQAMFSNPLLQSSPVPQLGGRDIPQVILQLSLRRRTTFICFIRALRLCHLTTGLHRSVVDGLEYLLIE